MIKKSVFENDLISGMERELHEQDSQRALTDVAKAVEYLQTAKSILERAGLQAKAQALDSIVRKIAQHHRKSKPAQEMPALHHLMQAGLTQKDIVELTKGNPAAKAKINQILRGLGRTDEEIGAFLGHHNVVPQETAESLIDPNRNLGKMWEWMQNPTQPLTSELPPKELEFKSISPKTELPADEEDEIAFKSIAQAFNEAADEADAKGKHHAPAKSKIPFKINDPHTKGLTPEKMTENLKHHGTVFNMANDGKAEQLLNSDVTDVDDDNDTLEVSDADYNLEMDFEDEI